MHLERRESQELLKRGFYQDIGLSQVQVRKRDGTIVHMMDHWDRTANKMVQQFKETGHPLFTATSALSRGTLKQNQVSIHAAVAHWCYNFALKEEKEHP